MEDCILMRWIALQQMKNKWMAITVLALLYFLSKMLKNKYLI